MNLSIVQNLLMYVCVWSGVCECDGRPCLHKG